MNKKIKYFIILFGTLTIIFGWLATNELMLVIGMISLAIGIIMELVSMNYDKGETHEIND